MSTLPRQTVVFDGAAADVKGPDTFNPPQNQLTRVLIDIFGADAWDDSAEETARRVLKTWREFSATPNIAELPFEFTTFEAEKGQLIIVKDIEFTSLCATPKPQNPVKVIDKFNLIIDKYRHLAFQGASNTFCGKLANEMQPRF